MNDEISSLRQRGIVWLTMAGWTVSGAFVLMALSVKMLFTVLSG